MRLCGAVDLLQLPQRLDAAVRGLQQRLRAPDRCRRHGEAGGHAIDQARHEHFRNHTVRLLPTPHS